MLEYDDVMNKQEKAFIKKKKCSLWRSLGMDISEMFNNICSFIASNYQEDRDFEGFQYAVISVLGCESPVDEKQFYQEKTEDIATQLYDSAYFSYKDRILKMSEKAMPIVQSVFEREGHRYENIAIPITDGKKTMQIIANLQRCVDNGARELALTIEKNLTLAIIDDAWKEHLREMDDLNSRCKPLLMSKRSALIYKFESYELFSRMLTGVYKDIVSFLNNGRIPILESQMCKKPDFR